MGSAITRDEPGRPAAAIRAHALCKVAANTRNVERLVASMEIVTALAAVAFSPNGATLAAGSGNNAIAFWNPQTGQLKRILKDATTIPVRKH